jgi:hypothetical protein
MAGELDVDAMLRRHTAKWFKEWEQYYALEPFGNVMLTKQVAMIAQMLYNINRGKDQKALPLDDFVLALLDEEDLKALQAKMEKRKRDAWQEQQNLLMLWAKVHKMIADEAAEKAAAAAAESAAAGE